MEQMFKNLNIPEQFKIDELIQNTYLLNGEIKIWTGDFTPVKSAIYIEGLKGELERKIIGSIPSMDEKDALKALDASYTAYDKGQGEWPQMNLKQRARQVQMFVDMMLDTREEVVKFMMWEIGKPYEDSCNEFDRTTEYIQDTLEAIEELDKEQSEIQSVSGINALVRRSPLGVVLCMGPYNYPLNEAFCLMIPALLCGNAVVFKPAKYGVLLLSPLVEIFQKCFPKGVVNFIYGSGKILITPIMKSGKIDVLALIGNSTTANALQGLHPKPNRLKLVLGLEAKNAGIIFSDADLEVAVNESVLGALAFNGQRCTALKILFVHADIIIEFNKKFIEKVSQLKYGLPWKEGVQITPLPEIDKPAYLQELIDDAKNNGAKIINKNGGVISENFVFPTVLYPVNKKMKVYHEEQFGPVVPIVLFKNNQEPIDYIFNSNYGQQASLFSQNGDTLRPIINKLVNQVSRVNINSKCQRGPDIFPFTGRKDSAVSTLSVVDALHSFSIQSMVSMRSTELKSDLIKLLCD
jgi:glyceraldehyde-3-phosphate dehydrogenase (NADP+)